MSEERRLHVKAKHLGPLLIYLVNQFPKYIRAEIVGLDLPDVAWVELRYIPEKPGDVEPSLDEEYRIAWAFHDGIRETS